MRVALCVLASLVLAGCGDAITPQRFTDCRGVAERVALENNSPEAILAVAGFPAEDADGTGEQRLLELETQRAGFMTVAHEQRIALGLIGANHYAQRYLKAYGECRAMDAGEQ